MATGFIHFDEVITPQKPTTQQLLLLLTAAQRGGILDAFAKKVPKGVLAHTEVDGKIIDRRLISYFYDLLEDVRDKATEYMKEQILVTPAVIEDGVETTPAVYNTAPTTQADLETELLPHFDLTVPQMTSVCDKMVAYSKHDASGDWTYYATGMAG
jgi:hypothetical protein